MIDLREYPRLNRMIRGSSDLGTVIDVVFGLCPDMKRLSGRFVIQHFLETAEITSWYTSEPSYLMTAILHDSREDINLSFEDVKQISGKVRVAEMVTALSKRPDLKNRQAREIEYLNRLSKAIEGNPWVGVIKLADRRSNLTDLHAVPPEKRKAIATQTLDFYVPMALRLGLPRLANALKELSLPHVI